MNYLPFRALTAWPKCPRTLGKLLLCLIKEIGERYRVIHTGHYQNLAGLFGEMTSGQNTNTYLSNNRDIKSNKLKTSIIFHMARFLLFSQGITLNIPGQ